MQADRQTLLIRVTGRALLAVWLFLGSLALSDQMNLIQETSGQDEQALLQLASGLKPDVPHLDGWLSRSGVANASVSRSFVGTEALSQVAYTTVQALPALRLHQLVSVYRI
jgi:hypothetical protein